MRFGAILAVAVLLGFAWYGTRGDEFAGSIERAKTPTAYQQPIGSEDPDPTALSQAKAHADARADARELERARRDAMYERILERQKLQRRSPSASPGGGDQDPATRRDDDEPAGDDELMNRIGPEHAETVKTIQRELLPLVDECVQLAKDRGQPTTGMLAIEVSAVGDEEVGAVVEEVGFPEVNELRDPELLECVRESSLAMSLPPPPEGGRTDFMLSLRVDDE